MQYWKRMTIASLSAAIFLASCMPKNSNPIITQSVMPAGTNTITTTQLPKPTRTQPVPTKLPTTPVMSNEEAYNQLITMLNDDNRCELPCWLNITPGVSSHSDAQHEWDSFLKMAGTTEAFPKDYLYVFEHVVDNNRISVRTHYYLSSESETIKSIYITSQALRSIGIGSYAAVYDTKIYKDILDSYLLSNILTTYGVPNQALLSMEIIEAEPTSPDVFNIWLLYPTRGVIAQYSGSAEVKNDIITGCPSDTFVSLWLMPPEDAELYQDTLEQAMGLPSSPFYKPTEDAIGMILDEFYETFRNPTSRCIESPLGIWPEH